VVKDIDWWIRNSFSMIDWLHSIAVRQAVVSTIVVLLAIMGFATAALVSVERNGRADIVRLIDTDIAGLADIMVQGGSLELQHRIADRTELENAAAPRPVYCLRDASGHRLAGNLATLPPLGAAISAVNEVWDGAQGHFVVRTTRLRGGLTLTVGRSLAPLQASIDGLKRTFTWLALITSALPIGIGYLMARRLAQRLGQINATFIAFDNGQRGIEPTNPSAPDEIDRLSHQVAIHLSRIEGLLQAQRNVTDNIAHELRTPLVHLDGRLLQALEISANPDVDGILHQARTDIRSVVALFEALLDIAMADADAYRGQTSMFDLSELAANIGDLYAASAEEAGLDFSTRIAPNISIRGEAMQLTRLIANLLDNAFKYAPAGSRVRLMLAEGPTIIVEDNGPGVSADHRKTIFQRFGRVDATQGGHGLGLALVDVIAARHGLSARVEDAAPGARFIVTRNGDA
jgi:signal transduction histidine kinase